MDIASIKAKDLMTKDVLSAYEGWSIKRLSSFLVKHSISGVPVIASDHSLVGVVSSSDVLDFDSKSQQEKHQMVKAVYREYSGVEYDDKDVQELARKADENCTVNQVMTQSVIKVDEETSIKDVVRLMLANNIHRVFVTQGEVMTGVITTSNLLTIMLEAA